MKARLFTRMLVLMVLPVACTSAWAGRDDEKGGITVDIRVHYNLAYRDGSWVPVDVVVANDEFDLSGWVEVRTFGVTRAPQSPIYRVPAECPKGSRKRFRLHCRLEQADRIEAWLYHKNRPALELPSSITVQPIAADDLLGLVLDDMPSDFGFLYQIAGPEKTERRFHRESLRNEQLGFLADYPQCYTPFDVIIMGDIDPERIALRHRELICRYVEAGGVLVVCTGAHTVNYRGTWVEPLLGVEIGPLEITNGQDLARDVFPEHDRKGAKPSSECALAQLTRKGNEIKLFGRDVALAALKPMGRGRVVTVAIDASSHALQGCEGYLKLWRELCAMRPAEKGLNLRAAADLCVDNLPTLTGVRIHPKSSVVKYLAIYFGVAIVGNWIVCSMLKRRELAWVLLIFFSIGFTAYAMIFGTVGRAKASELERIEVLRVRQGGGIADLHSIVGILTARTARYSAQLTDPFALARDVSSERIASLRYGRAGPRGGAVRPFYLVQDKPMTVRDLRVGASEMRLVHVEGTVRVPGGIEGQLTLDGTGLHGVLTNRTGLELDQAFILLDGGMYTVRKTPDGLAPAPVASEHIASGDFRGYPPGYIPARRAGTQLSAFRRWFAWSLFSDPASGQVSRTASGPYLCAWTARPGGDPFALDTPVPTKICETLLVADVEVDRAGQKPSPWRYLNVEPGAGRARRFPAIPTAEYWEEEAWVLALSHAAVVHVKIPGHLLAEGGGEMFIDLYYDTPDGTEFVLSSLGIEPGLRGELRPMPEAYQVGTPTEVFEVRTSSESRGRQGPMLQGYEVGGTKVVKATYRIDDWSVYYVRSEWCVRATVRLVRTANGPYASSRLAGRYMVSARVPVVNDTADNRRRWVTMAMIKTVGLRKHYGKLVALAGIDLEIEEGDIFGFIGPNGAGKTTTLRILATLLAPTAGQAFINGIDVMANPYEVKRIVGFMPDSFGVYDGMRLREYLDFFGAAYKIPRRKRSAIIDDVLALTDLTGKADDYVSAFSRGMKQRCCLAKTLIHDPRVLLLDEPASGLDPRARIEVKELLKTMRGMGKTILISSHILSELGDMCNKIGIIEHGEMLTAGDYHEILESVRQVREIRLDVLEGGDEAAQILEATPGLLNIDRSGNEFQMQSTLGRSELAELHRTLVFAGVKVVFFEEDLGTLEDVFLHVTKGGL